MLDFCLTIPWGAMLMLGGAVGVIMSGSLESGVAGIGIGGVLFALGWTSYQEYLNNKKKDAANRFNSPTYAYVILSRTSFRSRLMNFTLTLTCPRSSLDFHNHHHDV